MSYDVEKTEAMIEQLLAASNWLKAAEEILAARIFTSPEADPNLDLKLRHLAAYVAFKQGQWRAACRNAMAVANAYREQLPSFPRDPQAAWSSEWQDALLAEQLELFTPEQLLQFYAARAIVQLTVALVPEFDNDSLLEIDAGITVLDEVAAARKAGKIPAEDARLDELLAQIV